MVELSASYRGLVTDLYKGKHEIGSPLGDAERLLKHLAAADDLRLTLNSDRSADDPLCYQYQSLWSGPSDCRAVRGSLGPSSSRHHPPP